jgi:hypothetical protein
MSRRPGRIQEIMLGSGVKKMKITDQAQSNLSVTASTDAIVALDGAEHEKMEARIDPFLYGYFAMYARDLREEFPSRKIRNATVVQAAVQEFALRGLITLVKAHEAIPEWLPPGKVKLVKSKNGRPIWVPTKRLLENWMEISRVPTPTFRDGSLLWSDGTETPNRTVGLKRDDKVRTS